MALITITERTEGTFRMNKGEVSISYSRLRLISFIYIALPILCFFLGWLKWYWAILACTALIVCLLDSNARSRLGKLFSKMGKGNTSDSDTEDKRLEISKSALITFFVCSCIYLIFCGVGRLWAQSYDLAWRNAIFRDIILRDWPVYYDRFEGALSYYIGVWLPAAIPAKIVFMLSDNSEVAFTVGNLAFLVYYTIGLCIIFLLLTFYFQVTKNKQIFLIVIGFILFSGMDILGKFVIETGSGFNDMHLEWWSGFQYSSLTTCLCWVYNQALIPWICTALLLHEKKVSDYIFIGMACLFCGPFPFIGFFIYAVALGILRLADMVKAKKGKTFLREIFSVSNVFATLLVFPFIGSYLMSNSFMNAKGVGNAFSYALTWDGSYYLLYAIFVLFEFGIYAVLISKANKKNPLFYITVVQLLVYPFINIGINSDFAMRASIPAIFLMFVLCYQYLLTNSVIIPTEETELVGKTKTDMFIAKTNIVYVTLVLCLIIGSVTPGFEFARGIKQVSERGINDKETDYITLDRDSNPNPHFTSWPPVSFVTLDYDDVFFYKYFAKDRRTCL